MFESSVVIKLMNSNLDEFDDKHPDQYNYKKMLGSSYQSITKALTAIGQYWYDLDGKEEM